MSARQKRKKKSTLHPGVAVAILVVSAGFAFWSLRGILGDGTAAKIVDMVASGDEIEDEAPVVSDVVWRDLLAQHGSFDGAVTVPMVFSLTQPDSGLKIPPAAPSGETAWSGEWRGEDPPLLHVSVLMVHGAVRRAVVDGQVLGIGDRIGNGRVVAIEPGILRLDWQRRELVYDFADAAPREFRAELVRRGGTDGSRADATSANGERDYSDGRRR